MAEAKIKELSEIYELFQAPLGRIQVAAVQSVTLYGAEIWWRNQKNYQNEIQKLINQQACSITGIYLSTPTSASMSESGFISAHILLHFRKRSYTYRLHNLLDSISTKDILPITLQVEDGNAQPEN